MKPQEFIQLHGIARATRIVKTAPTWATYYDVEKHGFDDVAGENRVCLRKLGEVLMGCGL
ncbi:hypothetical protein I2F27_11230 [Acinetobacter sp. B5B]|uniref:hypothetical protein n=1 Tax=Acinetobacter baretiae TaxID=2605383 RepID=UPI0018C225C7|nr:hypothetical protein [Acinetobacter baretiae]MBF7683891.1 hypothetical protein [Acinetobacter baretiae]